MTGRGVVLLDNQLASVGQIIDASYLVSGLRLIKSPAEIAYARRAAELADDALDAALPLIGAGGDEADILTAMQGAVFSGGGDYPANEFIIGSGEDARSEEHTSELQSLMRSSYAVFCLKKKKETHLGHMKDTII